MTKAVTKKQDSSLAVSQNVNEWGAQEVSSQDLIIPKILPMQGLSQLVTQGEAKFGEFRDSINSNLLGDLDHPFEVIPFHVEKSWLIQKKNAKGKFEFAGIRPITKDNEDWEKEIVVDGVTYRRYYTYNIYVLIAKDVEEGAPFPHVLSLRSTSLKAGKKVYTQMFVTNRMAGKVPAAKVFEIRGIKTQNDEGTFVVVDTKVTRDSTQEEIEHAFTYYKMLQEGKGKVDHSDMNESDNNNNNNDASTVQDDERF